MEFRHFSILLLIFVVRGASQQSSNLKKTNSTTKSVLFRQLINKLKEKHFYAMKRIPDPIVQHAFNDLIFGMADLQCQINDLQLKNDTKVGTMRNTWGKNKTEQKVKNETIWFQLYLSAIQSFEDKHGYNAVINRQNIPLSEDYFEKMLRVSKSRWSWILQHVKNQEVDDLKELIQKSQFFNDYDDFADGIAKARQELWNVAVIKEGLLIGAPLKDQCFTENQQIYRALELFLNL